MRSSMADSSESNNPPQFEGEDPQQQSEITSNKTQSEHDDGDYMVDDFEDDYEEEEEEDEDSCSEEEEEDDDEDEEEQMDPAVTSARVSVNPVEVVGESNGCGGGDKVAVADERGEVDGLICPIYMGPWTSGGDHQVCHSSERGLGFMTIGLRNNAHSSRDYSHPWMREYLFKTRGLSTYSSMALQVFPVHATAAGR